MKSVAIIRPLEFSFFHYGSKNKHNSKDYKCPKETLAHI